MSLHLSRDVLDRGNESPFGSINLSQLIIGVMHKTAWAQVLRQLRVDKVNTMPVHTHKHPA